MNPAAAASIHEEPAKSRLPGVGEMVVYHMRPGHGRNGKTFFPAMVQGHGDRDTLMLTVIIDAGDLCDESLVEERKVGTEFHCWERVDQARWVASSSEGLDGVRRVLSDLENGVFGDWERPGISLIDILHDFESRLAALKAEVSDLRGIKPATLKGAKIR